MDTVDSDNYTRSDDAERNKHAAIGCAGMLVAAGLFVGAMALSRGCASPRSYNTNAGLPTNASPEGAVDYVGRKLLGR